MLLYFEDDAPAAARLALAAGLASALIDRHHFPDGEIKLRLPATLPERVVLFRSLYQPNDKLVELLLAAPTARELGALHLTLVAPYLAYMRQDIAFHPGEAVSQRLIGRVLAGLFDAVITVDPHLHRITRLQEAIPVPDAIVISAAPLLADLIVQHHTNALLVGPDAESAQWVAQAAARHSLDHGVCHKARHGDRAVEVTLPDMDVKGRHVVVLDDMISTGHTAAQAARQLLAAGAASVDVAATHALFTPEADQLLRGAGVQNIWSTDCIAHPTNTVAMAQTLAQALQQVSTHPVQQSR